MLISKTLRLFLDGLGRREEYEHYLNVFQADAIGCHIITATNDILKKLALVGKDLDAYSRETVEMFRSDALAAGYTIA